MSLVSNKSPKGNLGVLLKEAFDTASLTLGPVCGLGYGVWGISHQPFASR